MGVFKGREDGTRVLDFVGDFDALYEAEVDPWEQSGTSGIRSDYYSYSRRKLLRRLTSRLNSNAYGLEIGSGYGYLTQMLSKPFHMAGMDVSEIAIKRAEHYHPGIDFIRGDITADEFIPVGQFHFVILAQCWWYLLHKIDTVIRNCLFMLEPNGLLVISQAFLKEQNYAVDIADGFDGAMDLLRKFPSLRLVEAHYDDTGLLVYHDGLLIFRKVDNAESSDETEPYTEGTLG